MNTSRLMTAVIGCVIMASTSVATSPQNRKKPDQEPVKLTAELVQIDVLVADKDGKPVSGLKREDFEILDNNKPQSITHFSYEESNPGRIANSVSGQPQIPSAITARELKRVVAFVVDTLHMQFEDLHRTRKMLQSFVDNQMQPGDLVLILPTGGGSGLLQQFTSDRLLLQSAINRLRLVNVNRGLVAYRSMRAGLPASSAVLRTERGNPPNSANGRLSMPEPPGSHNADPLEEADVRVTLQTLNNLITSMRQLPGRKLGVFVSEGFRRFRTQTTQEFNETIGLASRSNVVFYSIDPRGLIAPYGAADEMGMTEQKSPLDLQDARNSLSSLAAETGGKFFSNNNDINKGLANLLDENAAYYLLGFQPEPAKWDGKLHKIKVAVRNRPDLQVVSRKSYLARSDAPKPVGADPKVEEVIDAISSPLVRRDIDLRLTALYIDNASREPVVTLLLHIDASKLHFTESAGSYHTRLEQIGFVLDATGRMVDKFSNTLELNLQAKTHQAALKQGVVATRTLNVTPGVYQARLFVRESGSGLIGTANDFIEIPDLKAADRLTASSLLLGVQQSRTGAAAGATPSKRKFPPNGEFSYSIVIYNARRDEKTRQPQLEMRMRILNGSKVVFGGQLSPVTPGEGSEPPYRIATGGSVKSLALPSGEYTLEIIVWDKLRKKESIVRRETDFSVE